MIILAKIKSKVIAYNFEEVYLVPVAEPNYFRVIDVHILGVWGGRDAT